MFKRKTDLLTIWEVSLLLALSLSLCLGTWAQGRQSGLSGKLVRLHVIAASDEEAEQALKLRVRDAVLEYLSPRLIGASESDQAQAILQQELAGIREWLPKFYPTVMKQYEATCRGERDLFF